MDAFQQQVLTALAEGTFVRLRVRRGDVRETWRRVELRGAPHLSGQVLDGPRASTCNLSLADPMTVLATVLAPPLRSAHLATTRRDWQLETRPDGSYRLHHSPPSQPAAPAASHDRTPERLLDPAQQPWLAPLGLATPDGALRASAQDKWRQVNKYVENVDALLRRHEAELRPDPAALWRVVDLAAGKGYLTFGLHAYLTQVRGWPTTTLGVERRPELVVLCQQAAKSSGFAPVDEAPGAPGLRFVSGDIDPTGLPIGTVDLVTALHACDTATDDAIAAGVRAGARVIMVAPCCHREVRKMMVVPPPLAGLLRHGIHQERQAEMLTDAWRALVLELCGYRVQVAEWVGGEHTPRNTMITAVRTGDVRPGAPAELTALREQFLTGDPRLSVLLADRL